MITIEAKLAQEIVERTMQIIGVNVNVMNARGIIIGSGEPSRIGDMHAGAQLALAQSRTVEIDTAAMRSLHGVKPGVNLPLTVRGEICGVVGLTGRPDAVRQFGELVRVTAEMILEQAQLIGELQREKRYREEFVSQLINVGDASHTSHADVDAWAARLGFDFDRPRAVVLLELADAGLTSDLALIDLQRAQQRLAAQQPELLTAVVAPRRMIVLEIFEASNKASARASGAETDRQRARQRLLAIDGIVRPSLNTPAALAIGVALAGIDGVALSFQSAQRTLRVGRQREPAATLYSYYELSLPVLLAGMDSGWQAGQLRRPLQRLDACDKDGALLRPTLAAWFACNGHALAAARALGIHRNTLDYRLRKIGELTGLDLASTDDRLLLYIALQLE